MPIVVAVVAIGVLAVMGWWFLAGPAGGDRNGGPLTSPVVRGEFVHLVTETGEVDSLRNVDVRCEVKSQGSPGTLILEVVPEGTYVQPGDFLVKLDSSSLEQEALAQEINVNSSKAAVVQAEAELEKAKIARIEYLEGTYLQERQIILSEIFVAEEDLRRAEQYLQYSRRLAAKGYVTTLQLEADAFAVEKAKGELETANTKLRVIDEYTKKKMLTELDSNILAADAQLKAQLNSHELDLSRLNDIREQIKKCVLTAPAAGQVKYANERNRRGGEDVIIEPGLQVRQGQVLIRLPDPSKMVVDSKINEAQIEMVKAGMKAKVSVDALPNAEFPGEVFRVNDYPEPSGWFSSNVKEYGTEVRILGTHKSLRPGLTAKVSIEVNRLPNVLMVPVQSVAEHGGKHYCLVERRDSWELRELKIHPHGVNDTMVVIDAGLQEGERVASNIRRHRDEVPWPQIPRSEQTPAETPESPYDSQPIEPPDSIAAGASPSDLGPSSAAGGRPGPASFMARLDANGDGQLGPDELNQVPAEFRSRLTALDSNGDGTVDAAELAAARERMGGGGAQ